MRRCCVFLGGQAARGVGVLLVMASLMAFAGIARANDGEQAVMAYACAVDRRKPSMPMTLQVSSTTAVGSLADPILQVPQG